MFGHNCNWEIEMGEIEHPGLLCERCEEPFALNMLAVGKMAVEHLPDPFLAKCPECGHNASYPRSAMRPHAAKS
jgi:hypothetical protein